MSSIVRIEHDRDKPYVVVSKSLTNDRRMSFRLRGILVYLLGKPAGWEARMSEIEGAGTESEDAVRSAFAEGRRLGYIKTITRRVKGRVQFEHVIYESPLASPCPEILNEDGSTYVPPTKRGKPNPENRTGITEPGFPSSETPVLVSNESTTTQSASKEREAPAAPARSGHPQEGPEAPNRPNTSPAVAGAANAAAVNPQTPSKVQAQASGNTQPTSATNNEKIPGGAARAGGPAGAASETEAYLRRKLSSAFVDRLFDEVQPLGVDRRKDWPALPLARAEELTAEAQRTHQAHNMKVPTRLRDLLDEECRRLSVPLAAPAAESATSASAAAPVSKYDRSAWSD